MKNSVVFGLLVSFILQPAIAKTQEVGDEDGCKTIIFEALTADHRRRVKLCIGLETSGRYIYRDTQKGMLIDQQWVSLKRIGYTSVKLTNIITLTAKDNTLYDFINGKDIKTGESFASVRTSKNDQYIGQIKLDPKTVVSATGFELDKLGIGEYVWEG